MHDPRMEWRRHGRTLVVRLSGELDVATAPTLREQVDRVWLGSGANHLLLDLSGITFLDSSGLGVILGRYRRSQQLGGKMALISPPASLLPTLELSGIFRLMRIFGDEQEALAVLEGVAG